jgi:hypothetical protein
MQKFAMMEINTTEIKPDAMIIFFTLSNITSWSYILAADILNQVLKNYAIPKNQVVILKFK